MNAYGLFWLSIKMILKGRGMATLWFDTEARKYEYHMAKIGSGYCQRKYGDTGDWTIAFYEEIS